MSAPEQKLPAPGEFRVVSSRRVPTTDMKRMGAFDTFLIYHDSDGQKHLIVLTKDHPSEGEVVAACKADVQERGQWTGKTYKL